MLTLLKNIPFVTCAVVSAAVIAGLAVSVLSLKVELSILRADKQELDIKLAKETVEKLKAQKEINDQNKKIEELTASIDAASIKAEPVLKSIKQWAVEARAEVNQHSDNFTEDSQKKLDNVEFLLTRFLNGN